MLEVISIVQLHILVCLPNIDDSHFDKMATILQEKMNFTLQRSGADTDTGSKTVEPLPEYYTDVRPVASSVKGSTVPATSVTSLRRHNFEQHIEDEYSICGWRTREVFSKMMLRPVKTHHGLHTMQCTKIQSNQSSHQRPCFPCSRRVLTLW